MFDWLFKKRKREQSEPKPAREHYTDSLPLLEPAQEKFKVGDFNAARELAEAYTQDTRPKLAREARKLVALSFFREGRYAESSALFEKLADGSNLPSDWFNLTTASTLGGDVEKGRTSFDNAVSYYKYHGKQEDLSIPNMTFYYMQCLKDVGQFERAFEQLKYLGNIYRELVITDSTFLWIRGVPFFEHTVDAAKGILSQIDPNAARSWVTSLKEKVDDDGKSYLLKVLTEQS
ncbi:MAG TPA: tetratricopeptide repeat protein [Flavobacteriales bacterium]|nr:tetratricopeptide repeat protein [Flavobacteriales bacterium]